MEIIISFLLSILAGIIATCICKWLNGKQRSNRPCLSAGIVSIEKPTDGTPWVFRVFIELNHFLLPTRIISQKSLSENNPLLFLQMVRRRFQVFVKQLASLQHQRNNVKIPLEVATPRGFVLLCFYSHSFAYMHYTMFYNILKYFIGPDYFPSKTSIKKAQGLNSPDFSFYFHDNSRLRLLLTQSLRYKLIKV